jgi:hypothetical protein
LTTCFHTSGPSGTSCRTGKINSLHGDDILQPGAAITGRPTSAAYWEQVQQDDVPPSSARIGNGDDRTVRMSSSVGVRWNHRGTRVALSTATLLHREEQDEFLNFREACSQFATFARLYLPPGIVQVGKPSVATSSLGSIATQAR